MVRRRVQSRGEPVLHRAHGRVGGPPGGAGFIPTGAIVPWAASEGIPEESQPGRARAPAMDSRLTRLLRAASVAERELWDFTKDHHPGTCDCRICDAWHTLFRARRDLSRPGSEIHDVVSATSIPLEGTTE